MIKTIRTDASGIRLDAYLPSVLDNISRSYVRRLIDDGRVRINGTPAKPSYRVEPGLEVVVDLPDPRPDRAVPQSIPLHIVYEDEWILVVDKPQGMVVHPAPGHQEGTLVNALLAYCGNQLSDLNGILRPGIVHRIDKDTSGLLLVVKDNRVHEKVAARIRRHEITRTYLAMVYGTMPAGEGTISAPIGRDPRNRKKMAVVQSGREATTHYRVLLAFRAASWIECRLETGRTHQIRVHLASLGHPVVGDPVYAPGRKDYGLAGQALHAAVLEFDHPATGVRMRLEAELPAHLRSLLENMT
ncbi:MAG: RluA family pseudouridine synthase [Clostridia bacterium]|nr:RluA family pseudouridine synthase [Clostridia bacterium]